MSVYSTPALRVGVYRCPPGDALWHETNDNIGDRPHVVFPATTVGLVRHGMRVTATPNDVVFYRPFETCERSLRDARGDVCLFIAPRDPRADPPPVPPRPHPARALRLAEAAKDLLLARLEQPLSLTAPAGELYVSPYHLARVFRAAPAGRRQ